MKRKEQSSAEKPKPQLTRVNRMLRRILPWLQSQRPRVATLAEIEKWTGTPENTIRGWLADQGNPTAEFLLALLERTPENPRQEIFDEFCRVYPRLEHSRLCGDRTVTSRLITLLGQSRGFTWIHGGNEEARTFLISALGHSFLSLGGPQRRVMGLDIHAPDWFVPVPGVVYLENILQCGELQHAVQMAWPQPRNGDTQLLIFNGLWCDLPDFQEKIRALAERGHVLVADDTGVNPAKSRDRFPPRMTLITIGSLSPGFKNIPLHIRAA